MQLQRPNRTQVVLCASVVHLGLLGGTWALSAGQAPSPQAAGTSPSAQGAASAAPAVLVPQAQVVYETVNSVQCVQVPVTQMQTQYRTEYRNENVPVKNKELAADQFAGYSLERIGIRRLDSVEVTRYYQLTGDDFVGHASGHGNGEERTTV